MGWFRSDTVKPEFTGLQIQTSASTLPIPIVWGCNKVAGNIIWYQNFQTQNSGGGKGGVFGSGSSQTTYTADVIIALCEGAIAGLGNIWQDSTTTNASALGLNVFNGATPQTTWGYLSSNYPTQAIAYQGTAYVGGRASISARRRASAITISRFKASTMATAPMASTPIRPG